MLIFPVQTQVTIVKICSYDFKNCKSVFCFFKPSTCKIIKKTFIAEPSTALILKYNVQFLIGFKIVDTAVNFCNFVTINLSFIEEDIDDIFSSKIE